MRTYELSDCDGSQVTINSSGKLDATIVGLSRKMDGIYSYGDNNKIFATLVCEGSAIANSDVSYTTITDPDDDDDEIVVTISQPFFVSTSEFDTDICPSPTILFRRVGCAIDYGCDVNDPSNKRWLAKAEVGTCSSNGRVSTKAKIFETGLLPSDGGGYSMGSIGGSNIPFNMDEGGKVSIDEDGTLRAKISNLVRSTDGQLTYEELFLSLVCKNRVVKSSDPVKVISAETDFLVENFVTQDDMEQCLGPLILVRRNGTGGTSSAARRNKKWIALSAFWFPNPPMEGTGI